MEPTQYLDVPNATEPMVKVAVAGRMYTIHWSLNPVDGGYKVGYRVELDGQVVHLCETPLEWAQFLVKEFQALTKPAE